jgi:hypothetical protein
MLGIFMSSHVHHPLNVFDPADIPPSSPAARAAQPQMIADG